MKRHPDLDVCYKLAYVTRETRRLRDEVHAADVAAPFRERFLAVIAEIEKRAADLRRASMAEGH